jgi:hypothetical protein
MKPSEKTISIDLTLSDCWSIRDAIIAARATSTRNQHWGRASILLLRIENLIEDFNDDNTSISFGEMLINDIKEALE